MVPACPSRCAPRCSSRWCPVAPKAPAWVWRWRARSRMNMEGSCATTAHRAPPPSPCGCRWSTDDPSPRVRRLQKVSSMNAEVWIVDDDRSVRYVLAEALREVGLAEREIGDAATVRAALREARPALLLTDVRMPGDDGLDLLAGLRAEGIGPVIVMSAYTDVVITAAVYRAGAVDYLAKPFDLDHAVASVQRALDSIAPPPA